MISVKTRNVAKESVEDYAVLTTAMQKADELILFYNSVKQDYPQWSSVIDDILRDISRHKGLISQLQKGTDAVDQEAAAIGEADAEKILNHGSIFVHDEACSDTECCPYGEPEIADDKIISMIVNDGSACEAVVDNTTPDKEDLLAFIADHREAAQDFVRFFEGQASFDENDKLKADELSADEIEGWILDHEMLGDDYQRRFLDTREDEYIVLSKESDDPEEAFLEYRYRDEYQAVSSFAQQSNPSALLKKDNSGSWYIQAQTPSCDAYKDLLSEQVELLNEAI